MGSLFLLQGIFLPQGSNPGLPRCRQIRYQLSHQGSPSEIREISQSQKDKHHVVLFIWDTRIAKLTETENRRVVAKVRQAWDMGLSAAALQCLHLDTPLLEQQNAKKIMRLKITSCMCSWGKFWTQKDTKRQKTKKQKTTHLLLLKSLEQKQDVGS